MGLLGTAAATMVGGERRVETAARNIANANTPGYKREITYSEVVDQAQATGPAALSPPVHRTATHDGQGGIVETGNPLDLAISGPAHLLVRDGTGFALSRGGQFALARGGLVVDALGRVLQRAGGGDLELRSAQVTIHADGTVAEGDVPVAAIALYDGAGLGADARLDAAAASALAEASGSVLRQGATERSNVTLSDEMVDLMRTQRMVESGAQMVRTYDQLMSQAISTFSRSK